MSHIHPHTRSIGCHCSLCKPTARPCGCGGCLIVTAKRKLRNIKTGKITTQVRQWDGAQYVFLPYNDQWEVVEIS